MSRSNLKQRIDARDRLDRVRSLVELHHVEEPASRMGLAHGGRDRPGLAAGRNELVEKPA